MRPSGISFRHASDVGCLAPRVLTLSIGAASHTGMVRERNEDSALQGRQLFAVADGMGGHAAGDVASRIAVKALMRLAANDELDSHSVVAAIAQANRDILDAISADRKLSGMGTTLTGVAIAGQGDDVRWVVFNVGDSRVYRFADDTLTQVTVDHSEVAELVAAGRLTAAEAKVYPRRNVVTRSLGTFPAPVPDVWLREPTPGERFLICSDGLTLEVGADQIAAALREEADPQRAADRLVSQAVYAGGRDNVTVIVVSNDTDPSETDASEPSAAAGSSA
jgi:PPM family protein phosphatase